MSDLFSLKVQQKSDKQKSGKQNERSQKREKFVVDSSQIAVTTRIFTNKHKLRLQTLLPADLR